MNLSSIRISTQSHEFICYTSLFLKAPWLQVCTLCACADAMWWTLNPYLSRRPHPPNAGMAASCRRDQTIKMDGDILVLLEPWYYRTLETGMTVTKPRSRVRGARRFALRARTKCISMTMMFVYTALLLCTRLSVLTNPERLQSASFMPSRLGHGL